MIEHNCGKTYNLDFLLSVPPFLNSALPHLSRLSLADNPWSCQCEFVRKFVVLFAASERTRDLVVDLGQARCYSAAEEAYIDLEANVTCTDAMAVMTPHARGGPGGGGSGHLSGLPALVAVSAASLVALCAAAAAVFVFRTPLRVWLHSRYGVRVLGDAAAKECGGVGGGGVGGGRDQLYDALVSCSVKDQDFVHQIIAAQLEHSDPPHKLCLAQRDFSNDPSSGNGESFRSASHLCSAHLLVVSRSYLDSMWPKVRTLQGVPSELRLGFVDLDFECSTAWDDGNLAEAAGQLGKMVEHRNHSQPNPGL